VKLFRLCTEPQAATRAPDAGAGKVHTYAWPQYDLTLCAVRVPVLDGKEGETTLVQCVRVKCVGDKAKLAHVDIPLSRVCDWTALTDEQIKASKDPAMSTQARAVGR
jgi:hypothetical protein